MGRGIRGLRWARSRRALLALGGLVGVAGLAPTADADPGDPALPARIFEALGVRSEIEAIAPIAIASLPAVPGASQADQRDLERIVRRGFAPDRIERAALHALISEFDLPRARDAANWLAGPEARKLRAAPPGCHAGAPASGDRRAAIARIEAALGDRERASRQARVVFERMRAVASDRLPGSPWLEPMPVERVGPPQAANAVCRFQPFSDDELQNVQRFVESDAGRWLYPAVSRALEDALANAAQRTVRALIERFEGRLPAPVRIAGRGDGSGFAPVRPAHGRRAPHG